MTTDLIRNALETIRELANSYMQNLDRRGDEWVVLTSMVDHNGALNQEARDKIVMTVFNITRETNVSAYQPTGGSGRGSADAFALVAPPLYIDVHLMVMANYTERYYSDGLAALSRMIGYFQQTPFFAHHNAPGLAPDIDKLTLEMESLSLGDVNAVTTMLGTRYLPSVFFKLRMIPFVSPAMQVRG